MLASYIAKHHWLADLLDAWIVERGSGRRPGHCFQVRDPSLLAPSPYLVPFGLIVDASALCPLVCARFSAVWVDEAMKFIVQTNLNWMINYQGDYGTKFFYLTNLPQSWFQIFFNCIVKEIGYSLSSFLSISNAKRKIPMAWSTFMVHSEGDTATSLPLLLCSGVGPWGAWLHDGLHGSLFGRHEGLQLLLL